MNAMTQICISFWISYLSLPVLLLIEKVIDLFVLKKNGFIRKMSRILIVDAVCVFVSYTILVGCSFVEYVCTDGRRTDLVLLAYFFFPLIYFSMSFVLLLLFRKLERKQIKQTTVSNTVTSKAMKSSLIIGAAYSVLFCAQMILIEYYLIFPKIIESYMGGKGPGMLPYFMRFGFIIIFFLLSIVAKCLYNRKMESRILKNDNVQ